MGAGHEVTEGLALGSAYLLRASSSGDTSTGRGGHSLKKKMMFNYCSQIIELIYSIFKSINL